MTTILLPIIALCIGLTALVWGADRFVAGSASMARALSISPLIIGLTVVSIGTSLPEVIVSVNAALKGIGQLAVGNALGSNMANIGLVLGITMLVAPIPVRKHLLRQESPVLLLITLLAGICLYDGLLGRAESIGLAMVLIPLFVLVVKYKKNPSGSEDMMEITSLSKLSAGFWFLTGLVVLLAGAEATVWGATSIATYMGVSELVIGLTVVAIGTSLPELAASVLSVLRGHHDIALGNIFGSNLFNLALVMTSAGIIAPVSLSDHVFTRDYLFMAALTLLMIVMVALALRNNGTSKLSRKSGLILLAAYCSYYILLWCSILGGP